MHYPGEQAAEVPLDADRGSPEQKQAAGEHYPEEQAVEVPPDADRDSPAAAVFWKQSW